MQDKQYYINLGGIIKQLRCRSGLSQKEVARRSGITISFISQVERGIAIPSLKSLRNIALAINTKVSYLLAEDKPNFKKIEVIKKDSNERIILQNGDNISVNFVD